MRNILLGALFFAHLSAAAPTFTGEAQLWLPDLVSTASSEIRITFSPDGKRMLWGTIGWQGGVGGWDIYESVRTATGWSKPVAVSFNSERNDFDPSFASDGSGVYFFSNRSGGLGGDDIWFAPFDSRTGYSKAENAGAAINTPRDEWAPVVSPDGKRLMFASDGRGGKGKHDLFVAAREGKAWGKAENLTELNSADEDFDATFLHDGATIVFTSGDLEGVVALYAAEFRDGHYRPRERLAAPVNLAGPDASALGPAVAPNEPGVLYFTSARPGGKGRADIYRITYR